MGSGRQFCNSDWGLWPHLPTTIALTKSPSSLPLLLRGDCCLSEPHCVNWSPQEGWEVDRGLRKEVRAGEASPCPFWPSKCTHGKGQWNDFHPRNVSTGYLLIFFPSRKLSLRWVWSPILSLPCSSYYWLLVHFFISIYQHFFLLLTAFIKGFFWGGRVVYILSSVMSLLIFQSSCFDLLLFFP